MIDALKNIGDDIQEVMDTWQVAGVAVAIIQSNEIIHLEGYGLRNVEENLPVTPDTQFAIGSATKAFTAFSVALMVEDGKMTWEQPIQELLPDFRLHDSVASERTTAVDLLSHRTGLPRHDFMWYGSDISRRELYQRLRYLAPNTDFRTSWYYQNLMYMTAGYLVGQLSNSTWEAVVQHRILDVLGMSNSNFSVADMQQTDNYAMPYEVKDGELRQMDFRNIDAVGPAGSINSSVRDMAKWLQVQLSEGNFEGEPIISATNLKKMHTPQMVINDAQFARLMQTDLNSYGLGWFIHPYQQYKMIEHGGNIDGFSALVSMIPSEKLGVVVLTNIQGRPAQQAISYMIYDRLLGLEQQDWLGLYKEFVEKAQAALEEGKTQSDEDRQPDTTPSHILDDYVGDYEHPAYGIFRVVNREDVLQAQFNHIDDPLNHYHYDVFTVEPDASPLRYKIAFSMDIQGNINALSIPLEPTLDAIVFKRLPATLSHDELLNFVGTYDFPMEDVLWEISLERDDTLMIQATGQGAYQLIPYQKLVFKVGGVPNATVKFVKNEHGDIIEARFIQGSAVFKAPRIE